MTSFLLIGLAVSVNEVVYLLGLIGWLPYAVTKIQGTGLCVLALLIIVTCYTTVVHKVKRQSQKIAGRNRGGAPAKPNAGAMTANKEKREVLPPDVKMPKHSDKPGGASISGQRVAAENKTAAATTTRKNSEPKLETRMLKLCLGITGLFAVSYAALLTRIVLNLSHNLDYLYSLNHVGNPVIYCMISKAYRKEVLDTAKLIIGTIKQTLIRR